MGTPRVLDFRKPGGRGIRWVMCAARVAGVTLAMLAVMSFIGSGTAGAFQPSQQTTTVYGLDIGNGHTWTVVASCTGSLAVTGYQNTHSPDETITANLSADGATINFSSTYVGGWDGAPYSWSGSFPVSGGSGTARTDTYTDGNNVYSFNAVANTTSSKPCNPNNPNVLGMTIPDAARAVLTQGELVNGVCVTSKWRSAEMFAAIDATAAAQPRAERALADAGIDYSLPNPQDFRDRGSAALASICGATTVDEAIARNQALIDVNTDMEASYGALSEALGGTIKANVDRIEAQVRGEINAFVDNERSKAEAALQADASTLAQSYSAEIQASAQAKLSADAAAMGAAGGSPAAINAAMQSRVDALKVDAQAQVDAKVKAALADRIAQSQKEITAKANDMGAAVKGKDEARLKPVGDAFDAMLNQVHDAVNAARTADTPERRSAIEVRVGLALKTADAFWAQTRPVLEANRATLASAKSAGNVTRNADDIITLWTTQRARLEQDLRAAMAAGEESAFVAATLAFQRAWTDMGLDAKRALGSKAPAAFDKLDGLSVDVNVNSGALKAMTLPPVMPLPKIDVVPPVPQMDFSLSVPTNIPSGPPAGAGPPSSIPSPGAIPPGYGPPAGVVPPPGATPPSGFTLPPGVTIPPGTTLPPGGGIPPGLTIPPGMTIPPGFGAP